MTLNDYAYRLCDKLNIKRPKIVMCKKLSTKTQLASVDLRTYTLSVVANKDERDIAFAIAHELRHIWQYENGKLKPEDHMQNSSVDTRTYNLQPEEIDANAFAAKIMMEFFGIRPLFLGLDKDIIDIIFNSAKDIVI